MMTCSTCNDYLNQLRRAKARGDNENFDAVRALYIQHLYHEHNMIAQPAPKPERDTLRAAFGRLGE
jgi:hypothetical protein